MRLTLHGKLHAGKAGTGILFCLMLLFAAFACPARAQPRQDMVPPVLTTPNMPLLPYLEYFLDKSGEMDEKEVISAENAQSFRQIDLKNLPHETGAVWLRFILAPLPAGTPASAIFLDLGESVPGMSVLKRKISALPEAGEYAKTCLVRLDGVPGPWFQPMLRTPEDAADNWERLARPAGVLSLAVVMLLCIFRCLTEKGQWRFWTAVYVCMALLQAYLGQPATDHGRIETGNAAAALAPGVALLLFSHVGRHLTGTRSRALNIQFFLLSLPGAALALFPLLSGFSWMARYLDLWPLGTLLYAPSALGAVMMGIPRTRRFLLGCLLPPLFTAAGLLLAGGDIPANLLASAPLWGIALSAMIIATTSTLTDETIPRDKTSAAYGDNTGIMADTDVYNLEEPLGDPNLRIIPVQTANEHADAEEKPPNAQSTASSDIPQSLAGDSIRLPLERLMQEGAALESCALPPAVRQHVANMLDAGREMADVISNPLRDPQTSSSKTHSIFNLQHLMRNAHDCVAPMAKASGIGLAWYMPPHLEHMYDGEAENLDQTVRMLLESAVRATRHGAVQFSVKRVPESTDAGHLLFTVKDTGSGMPPHNRSSLALTRVWELVGSHNGFLGMECSPQGTTIAFTLHLKCREDTAQESEQGSLPHVIIAAESAVERQLLSHMLKSLPCKSSETRSLHEALLLHKENPASLLVLHGRFADATASLLQQFTDTALAASLPFCKFLGITRDDSRWDAMAQEGFTHALIEPVDNESFRTTVCQILDEFPQKDTAAGNGDKTAIPEQTESAPGPQEAAAHDVDAASEPAHGHPPLPDIFAANATSEPIAQIKVPDLTALPDLLSFAESLRDSAKNSIDENARITPTDTFSGLFGHGPLPPFDMPSPDGVNDGFGKTDNNLPDLFAVRETSQDAAPKIELPTLEIPPRQKTTVLPAAQEIPTDTTRGEEPAPSAEADDAPNGTALSTPGTLPDAMPEIQLFLQKTDPPAEPLIPPEPARMEDAVPDEGDETPGSSAVSDDSAASAEQPKEEQASQEQEEPRSRLKHARRKILSRKGHAAPQAPGRNLSGASARSADVSQSTHRSTQFANDATEWVGEPMPILPQQAAAAAPLRGKLEIKPLRKEKTATAFPARTPHLSPAAPSPAGHGLVPQAPGRNPSGAPAGPSVTGTPRRKTQKPLPEPAQTPYASRDAQQPSQPANDASVEWVGDPMPIPQASATDSLRGRLEIKLPRKEKATNASPERVPHPADSGPVSHAEPAAPSSSLKADASPVTSSETKPQVMPFMDFIADMASSPGNTPRKADDQPGEATRVPTEAPAVKPQHRLEADNAMLHLVEQLDRAASDAQNAFAQRRATVVGEAARRIAAESDDYGLRVLARMARCVERAARANDMNALKDLLPELMTAVERNRIALSPRE
jgi:signal transduction histidine kinase